MRLLPIILAALMFLGCQTAPISYSELNEQIASGKTVSADALRESFLATEDLPSRLERLTELEEQALAIVEDEPLKLGSIGSAILDTYYGSLTGHYILARFYEYVDTPEAAAPHQDWVRRIQAAMEARGDGSREQPLPAMTMVEARTYAVTKGWSPVGSIYQTSDDVVFSLLLQAKPPSGAIHNLNFDLTPMYQSIREEFSRAGENQDFSPFTLIGLLAKQQDTAAQTAVGAFLATQDRLDDAVNWLHAASRTGNLLANAILARIYWEQARQSDDPEDRSALLDEVMENYLHAIALGSSDAMYALGVLYLNGHYGEENVISGVSLLQQAAELGNSDADMFLGHLYYSGEVVAQDNAQARTHYVRASSLGNPMARRAYARFLLDPATTQSGDPDLLEGLEDQAQAGDGEAMVLLGNLHARGLGTEPSTRRAISWFKRAVNEDPANANIVNEIAWTLTVSDQPGLRRPGYARRIMDHLMTSNPEARARPEYMDTWAATYAANDEFQRAIELQEEALATAESDDYQEVQEILRQHLEDFRAGRTITESVP